MSHSYSIRMYYCYSTCMYYVRIYIMTSKQPSLIIHMFQRMRFRLIAMPNRQMNALTIAKIVARHTRAGATILNQSANPWPDNVSSSLHKSAHAAKPQCNTPKFHTINLPAPYI